MSNTQTQNTAPSASAPIYSTETVDAKTTRIIDANGKTIATIARPVTLAAIRAAIAKANK